MAYGNAGMFGPDGLLSINVAGQLFPNKSVPVNVYLTGTTTLATLYTDRTKATAAANPVKTDASGNLTFFADPGQYDINYVPQGASAAVTQTVEVYLDYADKAPGVVGISNFPTYVSHGSTASTARPTGAVVVLWQGSVAPTNALANDLWWDTTNLLQKRYNGTSWESSGNGTYASLGADNVLTGGQFYRRNTSPAVTPINSYDSIYQTWQIGIDTNNHGGAVDWVLAAKGDRRGFADASLTSGSATIKSSSATFHSNDVGKAITGTGIPASTTISSIAATTIASASNLASLPQATINVASTTGFAASGTVQVLTSSGMQSVTYTGMTATSFTGCSGGYGIMVTGGTVRDPSLAVMSATATATATGVLVYVGNAASVGDAVYMNQNGGGPPTVGFGLTPPRYDYTVQAGGSGFVGSLLAQVTAGQTGDAFGSADSSGAVRVRITKDHYLTAQLSGGGGVTIFGNPATGGVSKTLTLLDSSLTYSYTLFHNSNGGLRLHYDVGNQDFVTWDTDGTTYQWGTWKHMGSTFGVFGATGTTQKTINGSRGGNAALADLLTKLASYGLIVDGTTT